MYAATWWRSIGVSKGDEMPRIWFCLLLVLLPLPFTSSSHLEDTPHTKSQHCKNQSQIAAHWPYPHLPILSPSVLLLILRLPGSIWEVSTTLPRKRHWPLGALRGSASFKPSTKLLTRDGCNLLRSWSNRMAWYWNDVFIQMYTASYLCEKFCHLLCNLNVYKNARNRSGGWAAEYLEKSWNHGICRSSFLVKETRVKWECWCCWWFLCPTYTQNNHKNDVYTCTYLIIRIIYGNCLICASLHV